MSSLPNIQTESSSTGAYPVVVPQLNLTLGLLEALTGDNSELAFAVPTQRVLAILTDWLQNSLYTLEVASPNPLFSFQFSAVNVSLVVQDCGCDPSKAVLATISLLTSAPIVGLLGPTCSAGALTSNLIASYYRIPEISYTATAVSLNVPQTFPFFFRVVTDDSYLLSVVVAMCRHYGWTHLGVLATDDSKGVSALLSLQAQASLAGLSIVATQTFTSGDTQNNLQAQFTQLRESTANVFVLWATLADCRFAVKRAQAYDFLRPSRFQAPYADVVWIVPPSCADNYTSDAQFLSALPGVLTFNNTIFNPSYSLYTQLNARYDALHGVNSSKALTYVSYCAFDAMLAFVFAASAELAAGVQPAAITGVGLRQQLLNLSFTGVTGRIQFVEAANVNHSFVVLNFQATQWSPTGVIQAVSLVPVGTATVVAYTTVPVSSYQNGSYDIVFPSDSQTVPKDLFVVVPTPAPSYSSGGGGVGAISTSTFIAIMVSIGGFLLLMIGVWASLWAWRRRMNRIAEELDEARRVATEAKEQAIMSNKAKSQFLANMSHEIRTPMVRLTSSCPLSAPSAVLLSRHPLCPSRVLSPSQNGVLGMSTLLSCTTLTPEQQEYVQAIIVSTDSLLSVINDVSHALRHTPTRTAAQLTPHVPSHSLCPAALRAPPRHVGAGLQQDREREAGAGARCAVDH